jgi:NodT family efflux transporter outer membrane factor (OMF) lipoprotein
MIGVLAHAHGSRVHLALAGILALLLAGCTVGPKYSKPATPVPPAFSEQPPASFKEVDGWKPAQPSDAALRGDWWQIFRDAQLNALEEQVDPANQTLKIAQANFDQARTLIKLNRSNLYPTVSANPGVAGEHLSANRPYPFAGNTTAADLVLPFDVSYEPDLWGRVRRSVTAARENAQAAAADLELVRLSLHAELAADYFEARSLDREKRLLDDTVVEYQKALDFNLNRFNGGLSSKAEVAQARTQLRDAESEDLDIGVARARYEHAVAVLIGQPPEQFRLAFAPLEVEPPAIPVGVPSQLLERRPDIAVAERQVAAANEQIGIAKAAFFPDVLLTAEAGLESRSILSWINWPSRFWAVGPQLAETIFDGGRRRAGVQIAQIDYDSTVANYRQTVLTAFQSVEDNLSTLRILEAEAAKRHEATLSAQDSLELSTNRYKGGLVTYLEVITAQSIALASERSEVDIERRRMDASVLLIKALGGGWDVSKLPKV